MVFDRLDLPEPVQSIKSRFKTKLNWIKSFVKTEFLRYWKKQFRKVNLYGFPDMFHTSHFKFQAYYDF